MLLKFKRDGRLKGWTCVDSWKQRKKSVPGESTSPIVSTDSVLITTTIDTHEGREVIIFNIQGVFLSADMYKDVKMALCGRLE